MRIIKKVVKKTLIKSNQTKITKVTNQTEVVILVAEEEI